LKQSDTKLQYLIDSYCGVGLFSICLANDFSGKVFGIEIDSNSIKYATKNAKLNGLKVPDKIQFIDGDAETMFSSPEFVNSGIVGEQSVVIMDPSRKGSTNLFLKQLVQLKPKMVVYVSCNVFTQARDLSAFNTFLKAQNLNYVVKDIVGFDFFPQTRHVETVAILELQE
jgi:tRNA (uracil-5-)-methyltransferase